MITQAQVATGMINATNLDDIVKTIASEWTTSGSTYYLSIIDPSSEWTIHTASAIVPRPSLNPELKWSGRNISMTTLAGNPSPHPTT
ncbi:hypothetical protein ABKN59_003717 [Abortiporus biennis]